MVAEKAGLPLADAMRVIEAHNAVVLSLLETGARVTALDKGYFETVTRKATRRRNNLKNPDEDIDVPARQALVFRESRRKPLPKPRARKKASRKKG
jgi:nucleoid DNA-binding protein